MKHFVFDPTLLSTCQGCRACIDGQLSTLAQQLLQLQRLRPLSRAAASPPWHRQWQCIIPRRKLLPEPRQLRELQLPPLNSGINVLHLNIRKKLLT